MSRLVVAIVVGLVAACVLSGCGGSSPISLPCNPRPAGALCIKVFHDGLDVRDVITYLSASESPLTDKKWRLALAVYRCDPGTGSVPSCRPAKIYPGPVRHGNPPIAISCRTANGSTTTVPVGCHDTLVQETALLGEFAGFKAPKEFTSRVWLCVSEELVQGAPGMPPTRACSEVS